MMSDETTLLSCPFCGGEAEKLTSSDGFTSIGCLKCNPLFGIMVQRVTEAEAVAAWNSRAPIEYDGWFYLPKPKEGIVDYGEPEITRTENGYKVRQIADVVDEAARRWGEELGEYVMRRICEMWSTHATQGTLTAEQVREAVESNSWAETSSIREFNDSSWQGIADELNSRAERTCKQEERGWSTEGDHARVWLTCGHDCMVPTVQDLPNYCPNCGAKVVGA